MSYKESKYPALFNKLLESLLGDFLHKRIMLRLFSILTILCCSSLSGFAQSHSTDSVDHHQVDVKIYFPYDQSYLDSTYMDNLAVLHYVDSLLRDTSYLSTIFKIEVLVQSSPEGRVEYNEQLSNRRKATLQQYFTTKYPEIDPSQWLFIAVAENWEEFREHLLEDQNLPNREQIFEIVDGDRDPDAKEWLLKIMDDGRPWQYIKEHILPFHRYGASILFIPRIPAIPAVPVDYPATPKAMAPIPQVEFPRTFEEVEMKSSEVLFAIKTNLVLDLVSVVNLAVEIPIGKRISVVGEVVYPWWRSWGSDFTMQIESYHGELKYWLGDRTTKEKLQGLYLGAYGGWGRYDIQPFSRTGVQGTFYDFGAEVGYSLPLSGSFNLDFFLGVGYLSTSYDDYYMANDTEEYGDIKVIPYPWMQNSLKTILPTRFGVSLVWTIKSRGGSK